MPNTPTRTHLRQRPFAGLRNLLDGGQPQPLLTAAAVRAELRRLVARGALNRTDGQDMLARLGLTSRPYRWAVGARVPVTVTVRAPNDGYATQAGAGQIIATLAVLPGAYLASPSHLTAPADHPVRHCLTGLRCQRTAPSPGYPIGGVYTLTAHALLAVTVTADNADHAWETARRQLEAELDCLPRIGAQPWRMRRTGLRHLTDLDT